MVISNTFTGTFDTDYTTTKEISMYLQDDVTPTKINAYINQSKVVVDAIYTTLTNAGYTVNCDLENCSLTVFGVTFYMPMTSAQEAFNSFYIKGNTSSHTPYSSGTSYGINPNTYMSSADKNKYKFIITLRGNDKHISIYINGYNNINTEYQLFRIAKCKNNLKPDEETTMIQIGCSTSSNCYFYDTLKPYEFVSYQASNNIILSTVASTILPDYGVGFGYIKFPVSTIGGQYTLLGMIQMNTAYVSKNKYYRVGNEIYYCDEYYGMIKVDNVASSTVTLNPVITENA